MSRQTHNRCKTRCHANDGYPVSSCSSIEIEMLNISPQAKSPKLSFSEYNEFQSGSGSTPQIVLVNDPQSSIYSLVPENHDRHHRPSGWKPGFWRNLPWLGIASLVVSFLCMLAAITVLYISNGKPTSSWKVTPTVSTYIRTS